MPNAVLVKSPGLLTTVQDLGRSEVQHLGIPACGAADPLALRVANILVSNIQNEACIECTLSGPVLEFTGIGSIAITGAETDARLNGYKVPMWTTLNVQEGDLLDLTRIIRGTRAYIGFAGGLEVPKVLGSKSTYMSVQLSKNMSRLKAGQSVAISEKQDAITPMAVKPESPLRLAYDLRSNQQVIRLVSGPQIDYFNDDNIKKLASEVYKVDANSNRMGLRLQGAKIEAENKKPLISDGIPWGAMQITRDGTPIIMLADRQPTGGYPKIAKVTMVDIPKVAQLKPGDEVCFKWVGLDEALSLYREQHGALEELSNQVKDSYPIDKAYRIYLGERMYQVDIQEKRE